MANPSIGRINATTTTMANARTRRAIIVSFWAVVIFLGFPAWWKTTTVYRAALPVDQMTAWSQGKFCKPTFPIRISIHAPNIPSIEARHLVRTTQHVLDDLSETFPHHLRLTLDHNDNSTTAAYNPDDREFSKIPSDLSVHLISDWTNSIPRSEFKAFSTELHIWYGSNQVPSATTTYSPLATFIATELKRTFAHEQAYLASILSSTNHDRMGSRPTDLSPIEDHLSRRTTRTFKYAPLYHLTLSLFTSSSTPYDWEIEPAIKDSFLPLLSTFSSITKFTIDTQVQLHSSFSSTMQPPKYDSDHQRWTLSRNDLSGFINAAEWPLSPGMGTGPTINFVLHVPAQNQRPLVVEGSGSSGWLIPRWGSVFILNNNLSISSKSRLSKSDLQPALDAFSRDLLSLMGVVDYPPSLPFQLASFTRTHTASLLLSSSSTMKALSRLALTLSSIAIPDAVAQSVSLTLSHLHAGCAALQIGNYSLALMHTRKAELEAERAFFEPSMVGQVYFPEEHKIAVYSPLIGPVAVPLVLATIRELGSIFSSFKFKHVLWSDRIPASG